MTNFKKMENDICLKKWKEYVNCIKKKKDCSNKLLIFSICRKKIF